MHGQRRRIAVRVPRFQPRLVFVGHGGLWLDHQSFHDPTDHQRVGLVVDRQHHRGRQRRLRERDDPLDAPPRRARRRQSPA
ncbi:MAG TPA: hypothetical protein VIE36_16115, partial [Methylomirabilota bacterium]